MMRLVDCIEKKRDGHPLSTEEIQFIIKGYTEGEIPDYQISALAMAIYFQGMTVEEVADLTMAMVDSGDTIDLSSIDGVKVDKHSTGGVGDTTTLILAPLVAALGVPIAKMSGRGLGNTGGTIDKLESIPGFHVELDNQQFIELVNRHKIAVVGQSGNLTPADKKLYALRDVTGTVDSIPLIASSIMSKKIAAGADAFVLDVKAGSGAFMKNIDDAKMLAKTMVQIGHRVGKQSVAVISDMSQPLGCAIGNALEVKEAIETLKGQGPRDLEKLCLTLGSHMVYLARKATSLEEAEEQLKAVMASGEALEKFKVFIQSQGGNASIIDTPSKLPQARYQMAIKAEKRGVVSRIVANAMGMAAMHLGAGRMTKETVIDYAVGIVLHKKVGDKVEKGDTLVTIHANTQDIEAIKQSIRQGIEITDKVDKSPLIYDIITD